MVQPITFGQGAAFAAGAASSTVQRKLRKMSEHPEDPRIFSQAKILVPIGGLVSLAMTLVMYFPISDYLAGRTDDIWSVIIPSLVTVMGYTLLLHGLFRRFGVDREKVWTRFGKLFYREVRFDQIDRFSIGVDRYKVYANGTLVNIDYNRFDYTLVSLRLLEELRTRRFKLRDVEIDDPRWEDEAQSHRNIFASDVYVSHQAYFDAHPEELDRLNALVQPPASYKN